MRQVCVPPKTRKIFHMAEDKPEWNLPDNQTHGWNNLQIHSSLPENENQLKHEQRELNSWQILSVDEKHT